MTIPDWFPIQALPDLKAYSDFSLVTEGGFGEIYSALRTGPQGSTEVIVKRLRPLFAPDPKQRDLFTREAGYYKFFHHPQIPKYFEGVLSDQECFFIMEHIAGTDPARLLQNARASGAEISTELILTLGIKACEVLHYLHHYESESEKLDPVIHCDIKPHNFLLTPLGELFLIDFSVAQFLNRPTASLGGTPSFMAPERLGAQELTTQVDLFPLTLTIFFLLTHGPLLKGKTWAELLGGYLQNHYIQSIQAQNFPPPLEAFFLKNLHLKPERRAPDALALKQDIQDLMKSLGLQSDPVKFQEEIRRLSQIS